MSEGLKLYWWTFFFITALSSRAVDGHQKYSRGSVVGKDSFIDPEISPTTSLISTREGSKSAKLAWSSTLLNFEPPAFENASNYPNSWNKLATQRWSPCVLAKFGQVGSTHPWEPFGKSAPPPKIARRKRAIFLLNRHSSITQPSIIRFCSNCVQNLNTWHPKCCRSSKFKRS